MQGSAVNGGVYVLESKDSLWCDGICIRAFGAGCLVRIRKAAKNPRGSQGTGGRGAARCAGTSTRYGLSRCTP